MLNPGRAWLNRPMIQTTIPLRRLRYDTGTLQAQATCTFLGALVRGKIMVMRKKSLIRTLVLMVIGLIVFGPAPHSFAQQQGANEPEDFFEMSIEELMEVEVEVTSSARRPQRLARAASAVYVITAEDIRQAGVTHLGDLMRLVPGMDIAQFESSGFAMSVRGLARPVSPRIQILQDGRHLYDAGMGGMKFETYPIFLENIERIEVIRGSGGVIWGVNAMNGVINIITKKSADTQGGFAYGGFGNKEFDRGFLRFGGTNGPLSWRGTTGAFHHGKDAEPHQAFRATGRADLKLSNDTTLTFSGGHQNNTESEGPHQMNYMNLLWQKKLDDESSIQVRWSETYSQDFHNEHSMRTREDMLEMQHYFVSGIHSIVWGSDYTRDIGHMYHWRPDSFANDQLSAFIEDEITLADNLWFTIGNRQHYNELTHHDWAGRAALVWEIAPRHFIRGAVSRSFRRPIFSEEFDYTAGTILGNDSLRNERLVSYELGYRGKLKDNLELNVEGFVNKHKDLIGKKGSSPAVWNNVLDVTTYGIETAIDYRPFKWWLVRGFHAYEHQTDEKNLNDSNTGKLSVCTVPKHKLGLTNRFYLDKSTILNTQLYWSDTFFNLNDPGERVDPYFRFDIRLGKTFWNDNAELAFGIKNLTDQSHSEGGNYEVPRQVYFQFFYRF